MKNWWQELSFREKQTISLGMLLLLIFLVYEFVFAELSSEITALRHKISANQNLLSWMQASNEHIEALEKTHQPHSHTDGTSLLSTVQNGITESNFAQNVTQLQQSENDSVQLQLQKVNFDAFVQWLTQLCQQHQLLITQMSITPLDEMGTVNTELKLSRG